MQLSSLSSLSAESPLPGTHMPAPRGGGGGGGGGGGTRCTFQAESFAIFLDAALSGSLPCKTLLNSCQSPMNP